MFGAFILSITEPVREDQAAGNVLRLFGRPLDFSCTPSQVQCWATDKGTSRLQEAVSPQGHAQLLLCFLSWDFSVFFSLLGAQCSEPSAASPVQLTSKRVNWATEEDVEQERTPKVIQSGLDVGGGGTKGTQRGKVTVCNQRAYLH